jgi:hypothetical protein
MSKLAELLCHASPDVRKANPGLFAPATPVVAELGIGRQMSNAEHEAKRVLVRLTSRDDLAYEGLLIEFANGHRYTPDFYSASGKFAVEVKGKYKLGSQGRSRLAFDQARIERPDLAWIWMELRKQGAGKAEHWRIEVY